MVDSNVSTLLIVLYSVSVMLVLVDGGRSLGYSLLDNCNRDCSLKGIDGTVIKCWIERLNYNQGSAISNSPISRGYRHLPPGPQAVSIVLSPERDNTTLVIQWQPRIPRIEKLRHFLLKTSMDYISEQNTARARTDFFLVNFLRTKTLSSANIDFTTSFSMVCSSISEAAKTMSAEVWSLPGLQTPYKNIINKHSHARAPSIQLDLDMRYRRQNAIKCMCRSRVYIDYNFTKNNVSSKVLFIEWPLAGSYRIRLFPEKSGETYEMRIDNSTRKGDREEVSVSAAVHHKGKYFIRVTRRCPDSHRTLVPRNCHPPIVQTEPFHIRDLGGRTRESRLHLRAPRHIPCK